MKRRGYRIVVLIVSSLIIMALMSSCIQEASTIEITTEPQLSNTGHERTSPAGRNVKLSGNLSMGGPEVYSYNLEMWVSDVKRGKPALDLLRNRNPETPEAPADDEYIVVKVNVHFTQISSPSVPSYRVSEKLTLTGQQFDAFPIDGTAYPPTAVDPPVPPFEVTLIDGDTSDGWIVLQVPKTDSKPILKFRCLYVGEYKEAQVQQIVFWFRLY